VFFWGEADMMWTTAVAELFHWRRRRRVIDSWATELIEEAEAWLAGHELPRRPIDDPPTYN
jgi:hypothetical protein